MTAFASEFGAPAPRTQDLSVLPPERLGHDRATAASWVGAVFLPSRPAPPEATEFAVELRELTDGRLAVFAYTTLDRLVEGCGPDQPWVAVDSGRVAEVQREACADLVAWDVPLPEELRHRTEVGR